MILASAVIAFSYYHSREVYTFWLKKYYIDYKKMPEKEMMSQAYDLMKKKDIEGLKRQTGIVLLLYPDNNEARLMLGIAMLRLGQTEEGLTEIVSVSEGVRLPGALIDECVEALFSYKYYGEVISLLKGRKSGNPETVYYLGVSLYEKARYEAALARLREAMNIGKNNADILYYCSLCSDKLGNPGDAMKYMIRAWDTGPRDRRLAERMVDLYRRAGKTAEAEKILRRPRL